MLEEIEQISSSISRSIGGMADNVKAKVKETGDTVKKEATEMGKIINSGFARAVAGGIENVTNSLIKGEDVFKNFGNFILGVFGDLSIQLGTFFIAQATAALAMTSLDFTGTLAAGAGLIALGAILKSFASSGGASASASVSSQTGGDSYGVLNGDSSLTTQPETRDTSQQLVINIQGDYIETEDTALRIVDMINRTIDRNGISLRGA